ncbi:uncharacterized protein LOC122536539 [Frieseomelitta varia]|uniref:uncharacterized protein LOC122536539 n=1 Tax=Frieseomelitta varia TaxID=561572 RepID=UPI001CB6873C|nr:uncharacterized protein LOC122536539 [Frieseomelitta varia]
MVAKTMAVQFRGICLFVQNCQEFQELMSVYVTNCAGRSSKAAKVIAHRNQWLRVVQTIRLNPLEAKSNNKRRKQCNPHDKESDYWGGGRGAKQGYEAKMNADHGQLQKGELSLLPSSILIGSLNRP